MNKFIILTLVAILVGLLVVWNVMSGLASLNMTLDFMTKLFGG